MCRSPSHLIGRFVSAGRWAEVMETALAQGTWVVQEYLEPAPYLFQASECGAAPAITLDVEESRGGRVEYPPR